MKTPAAIVGLAIGDALGQPFEFCNQEMSSKSDWHGEYLPGNALKPGQWTDDTKMAICLAQSLLGAGKFDAQRTATEYLKWYNSRDLRGIGLQTTRALHNMLEGVALGECGTMIRSGSVCGNGTAMRVTPLGIFFRNDLVSLIKGAMEDAELTHNHKDAKDGSVAVAYISALLANGTRPLEAVAETIAVLPAGHVKESLVLADKMAFESKKWDDALTVFSDNGTSHQTVGSAAFCLLRYCDDGFKHVVINSIKIGGDTNTRGAIAGAWAGIYCGIEEVPEEYLEELEHGELLEAIDVLLMAGPEKLKKEKEALSHSSKRLGR